MRRATMILQAAMLLLLAIAARPAAATTAPETFVVAPDPPRVWRADTAATDMAEIRTKPFRPVDPDAFRAAKEGPAPSPPAAPPAAEPALPLAQPALVSGFLGIRLTETAGQGFLAVPPDSQVAAGPSHLFVVVNVSGRILTKAGAVVSTFPLAGFFGLPGGAFAADPRVRFDPVSGRWFVSLITIEGTDGTWRLAVSKTSTPSGNPADYVFYTVPTTGRFPDYDTLGISSDKVILTANAFSCTPSCQTGPFLGPEFVVLNKAQLVAGTTATGTAFLSSNPVNAGVATIQAAMSLSPTTTHFMVAGNLASPTTALRIYAVTGVPGVTPVSAAIVTRGIAALPIPPDAVQQGSGVLVATNDDRFLDLVYRDGVLWAAANGGCVPAGDGAVRACMRFVQITTAGLTIARDFDFGTAGRYYYYPAVSIDSAGNLLAVFSRSSSSEFASVYASGRLAASAASTLEPPILVKAGEAAYDPVADGFSQRRWGDYSAAALDPSDPTMVWTAGEYARVEGGAEWGVWLGQITIATMFADVPAGSPFRPWIEALFNAGVTGGCASGPLRYCPQGAVTREQMAVFLLKASLGAGHTPPACTTAPFPDVPCSSIFAPWIQDLVARGITAGCGAGNYCPGSPVTREQMAVFLLKASLGAGHTPPACTTAPFGDVPCSSIFAPWIQDLVARGITSGCGGGNYCPTSPVTREQMAVFLVKAFSLPFP